MDAVRARRASNKLENTTSRRTRLKIHRRLRRHSKKNWCQIYVLREGPDLAPRYVGQTRMLPDERLRWHVKTVFKRIAMGNRLSPVQKWIAALTENGIKPVIEVIDANGTWDTSEAVWIDRLRRDGTELLNVESVVD